MKTTATEQEPCQYRIAATFTNAEVDAAFDKAYQTVSAKANIKGFRPGHAPRRILERKFGEDVAREVTGDLLQEGFLAAMKEHDLAPIADPNVDFDQYKAEPGAEFSFEAEVDVRPKFEMPAYKGIALTEAIPPVTEEEIQTQLDQMRQAFSTLEEVDGGVQVGDMIEADVHITVDGEELLSLEDCRIASESGKVVGIDARNLGEELQGAKAGDVRTVEGEVPETYHREEARGKAATMTVTVKKVERPTLPELDDEFAKRMGFETMDTIREKVVEHLKRGKRMEASEAMEKQAVESLLGAVEMPMPTAFINRQVEARVEHQKRLLAPDGGELDAENAKKLEEFRDTIQKETEDSTKRMIVFSTIADEEKIEVTEQDAQEHIGRLAQAYRTSPAEMLQRLQELRALPAVAQEIRDIKVTRFILDHASITRQDDADAS